MGDENCMEGLECRGGGCYPPYVQLDGECDASVFMFCDPSLECRGDTCLRPLVMIDEACDDTL